MEQLEAIRESDDMGNLDYERRIHFKARLSCFASMYSDPWLRWRHIFGDVLQPSGGEALERVPISVPSAPLCDPTLIPGTVGQH